MTPRVVLVLVAGGLVAAACASDPSPEAADQAATDTTDTTEATDTAGATETATDPTCRRELAELDRRDEAGTIDWDAIEYADDEPTEAELESVTIEREPYPTDVPAPGERPVFPDFPDRLDIAALSDEALVEAVEACYEIGLLADDDEADGEPDDDEAG